MNLRRMHLDWRWEVARRRWEIYVLRYVIKLRYEV